MRLTLRIIMTGSFVTFLLTVCCGVLGLFNAWDIRETSIPFFKNTPTYVITLLMCFSTTLMAGLVELKMR